jgi:hypothetical protein
MAALYVKRRAFVAEFLAGKPCELRAMSPCFGAMTCHESLARSAGGSILPDAKARAQGQTFHALCVGHHSWVTDNPKAARARGFVRSRYQETGGN